MPAAPPPVPDTGPQVSAPPAPLVAATRSGLRLDGRWGGLAAVALLDAAVLVLVVLLAATVGTGPRGLGPYLATAASHATGGTGLVLATLLVAAFGAAFETVLRLHLQAPLAAATGRSGWAIVAVAVVQALTHLWFNTAGAACAFILSVLAGVAFARGARWWVLAAWHAQANALAMVATMALALIAPGTARTEALFAYKGGQVDAGKLIVLDGWGWFDRTHADAWLYAQARDAIAGGSGRAELLWQHRDVRGVRSVRRTYAWDPERISGPHEAWAVCAGMMMDITSASEAYQDASPWWSAGQLSAWQFDDAPSTVYHCLSLAPEDLSPPHLREVTDVRALRARWQREGRALVALRITSHALPAGADPALQRLLDRIDAARAWWHVVPGHPDG